MSSLRDQIAEAIPVALTATAAVGVGTARRLKIADAVLPVVQPLLDAQAAEIEQLKRELGTADRNEAALTKAAHQTDELAADALADAETYAAMARQAEDERDRLTAGLRDLLAAIEDQGLCDNPACTQPNCIARLARAALGQGEDRNEAP